jgi:ribonuclease D
MQVPFIETPGGLAELAERLARAPWLAIDTESNSLHAWREKVCVLQIASPEGVALVDTVVLRDLSILRSVFEDERILKYLHGADYDVVCLKRDFGFGPKRIFDTMLASQMLGFESFGLAAMADSLLGVTIDKAYTRHDWGARPIAAAVQPYLVNDVLHLPRLAERLMQLVSERGIQEEVEIECQRVEALQWSGQARDEREGWRQMKGVRDLDAVGQGVIRELFAWREGRAEAMDRPAFKVLGNDALLEIARRLPRARRELYGVIGLNERMLERHGSGLLQCVQRGVEAPADPPPRRPRRTEEDYRREETGEALRQWRRGVVQQSGAPSLVVLPNHVLERLATQRPQSLEELALIPSLGAQRRRLYGPALLEVLRPFGPGVSGLP